MKGVPRLVAASALLWLSACQTAPEDPVGQNAAQVLKPGLSDTRWRFVRFATEDDPPRVREPGPRAFTIQFHGDGTLSGQLACNAITGEWNEGPLRDWGTALYLTSVSLGPMTCPADGVTFFLAGQMKNVNSYTMSDGEMHMALMDGATLSFEPME